MNRQSFNSGYKKPNLILFKDTYPCGCNISEPGKTFDYHSCDKATFNEPLGVINSQFPIDTLNMFYQLPPLPADHPFAPINEWADRTMRTISGEFDDR